MPSSLLLLAALAGCRDTQRALVQAFDRPYEASASEARFTAGDATRKRVDVRLVAVATGLTQPTDAVPAQGGYLVLEKGGNLRYARGGTGRTLLTLDVTTVSEQGLLGIALAPDFEATGRFVLHYTTKKDGKDVSRVQHFRALGDLATAGVEAGGVILELEQPYQNHNGGNVRFGPDGMLYVGFGDGGFRNDPLLAGQDLGVWLGKMLRLDVAGPEGYRVPPDNPLVGRDGARPEIWAWGLRNPWRYAFAPDGRLVVADVGQNTWEEVDLVAAGDNLGWNVKEGFACFRPETGCDGTGLVDPIWAYGRDEGQSITGGVVVTGSGVPALQGLYVAGDFVSGRVWAFPLPAESRPVREEEVLALGQLGILPSSFALTPAGDLLVVDFGAGALLEVVSP